MGNSPLRRDDEFLGKCHEGKDCPKDSKCQEGKDCPKDSKCQEGKDCPKDSKCHHGIVDHLLQRYSAIAAGQEVPRVVVLQGASGVGKSRIIREVYERLRVSQQSTNGHDQGYWPALEVDLFSAQEKSDKWQEARKVLGPPLPEFARPARTLPDFFWWSALAQKRSDGQLQGVRSELNDQMEAHLLFLQYARSISQPMYKRAWEAAVTQGKDLSWAALKEAGVTGLGALLKLSAGVTVPGLGIVVDKGIEASSTGIRRMKVKRLVEEGGDLTKSNAAKELARAAQWLATPDLPIVLVIEDMHLMSSDLDDFLNTLVAPAKDSPVLVIGSAWPEAEGGHRRPDYHRWVTAAVDESRGPALAETIDVKPLSGADLIELARRYAPNTDDATLGRLADQWPNPYALKLALTSGRIRRRIRGGRLAITDEELKHLPKTIEGLYRERWAELPDPAREALTLAAGCLPASGSGAEGELWPFLGSIVAKAAAQCGLLDDANLTTDDLQGSLREAADPYEWTREHDPAPELAQFREYVQATIAAKAYEDDYGEDCLKKATAEALLEWWDTLADEAGTILIEDRRALPVAHWLAALPAPDDLTDEERDRFRRVCAAAAYIRALDLASVYDYRGAADALALVDLKAFGAHDPTRFMIERMRAVWTGRSGAPGKAARQLAELRQAVTLACEGTAEASPGLETELFLTWAEEAHWTAVVGRLEDALTSYKDLLECQLGRRESAIDRDALEVAILDTRFAIADLHGRRGDYPEAQEQLRDVVRAKHAMHDLAPAVTFRTRERLAHWAGEAGDPAAAIGQLEALLVEQQTASGQEQGPGAGQRDALRTRVAIARWKCRAGRHQEARADLDELISVMPRDGRNAEGHRSTASAARYLRHTCHTQHEPRSEHDERDGGDEESDPTLAALQEAWGMSADSERQAMAARLLDDIWFRQWYPLPTRSSAG